MNWFRKFELVEGFEICIFLDRLVGLVCQNVLIIQTEQNPIPKVLFIPLLHNFND